MEPQAGEVPSVEDAARQPYVDQRGHKLVCENRSMREVLRPATEQGFDSLQIELPRCDRLCDKRNQPDHQNEHICGISMTGINISVCATNRHSARMRRSSSFQKIPATHFMIGPTPRWWHIHEPISSDPTGLKV